MDDEDLRSRLDGKLGGVWEVGSGFGVSMGLARGGISMRL